MAKGGRGEVVKKEDLWDCLFGGIDQNQSSFVLDNSDLRHDPEVSRHLRAEAADERQTASASA